MTIEPNSPQSPSQAEKLTALAQLFLRLGAVGFGGPQAHIAMINAETVQRRQWFTQAEFTEAMAICEMLPGPASTQMGIYAGYLYAGPWGALVSGFCFIAPAFVIVVGLSWLYFEFQGVPQLTGIFLGVSPVVTAIILSFCWKLGKKTITHWTSVAIAAAVFALVVTTNISVLILFLGAGLVGFLLHRPSASSRSLLPIWPLIATSTFPTETLTLGSFWGTDRTVAYTLPLVIFFVKVGAFIFGGGLVIIPLLEFEVVEKLAWLTREEFINGVAIGQLSPGPVVLTSAFVGFKVAGLWGALVSAIAIFLPSFVFIMALAPVLTRLRQQPAVKAFLKGVTPAVLGAIAAAAVPLAQSSLSQPNVLSSGIALIILLAAIFAQLRLKIPTWLLVLAGGLIGWLSSGLIS
ncbi:MAG: chromate efflux transporter [Cyanobacteria bacterium P01_H01_bin.15]